jgi:hypothetical protein
MDDYWRASLTEIFAGFSFIALIHALNPLVK